MADKIQDYLREQLRKAREEQNLSQQAVAEKVGITRTMLSDYELGRVRISAAELYRLSVCLEKPITYFFPGMTESDLTGEEHSLLAALRQLDPDWREYVLDMVSGLVDLFLEDDYKAQTEFEEFLEENGLKAYTDNQGRWVLTDGEKSLTIPPGGSIPVLRIRLKHSKSDETAEESRSDMHT